MTAPDALRESAPADGVSPGGRIVVTEPRAEAVEPPVGWSYGPGLWRLLRLAAREMPAEEVLQVWAFPGVVREGREYGVAVITRRGAGYEEVRRDRVYRARWMLQLKGQDRGRAVLELEETAEAPGEVLPRIIEGVGRRADEAGEALEVDLRLWREAAGIGRAET